MAKNIAGIRTNSGITMMHIAFRMSIWDTSTAPKGCTMNWTTRAIAMVPRNVPRL